MKSSGRGPPTVRQILLDRKILSSGLSLFARGAWSSEKRAEVKCWAAGPALTETGSDAAERIGIAKLGTRSRTLAGARDPMLAQEWAYGVWDEYVAEVKGAIR